MTIAPRELLRSATRVASLAVWALAIAAGPPVARADTLVAIEHQITAGAADRFYFTMPRLGQDAVSKLVVYTRNEVLAGGALGPGDIFYQRLTDDGAPNGPPVRVTAGFYDDELDDVSGDYIVFTAYDSTTTTTGRIMVYQISTQVMRVAGNAVVLGEPRIHGDTLVWREGASGATQVMRFQLSWFGTNQSPVVIAGPVPPAFDVDLGDRFAVYSTWQDGQYHVEAYDLALSQPVPVSVLPGASEYNPSISGAWVTWVEFDSTMRALRILARDLDTSELRVVADNGAGSYRPSISGDLITYESNPAGNLDVYVHRLSTSETFRVTTDASDQFLNDVFGDLVAYVDLRNGNDDIYVAHLQFVPPNRPPIADAGPDLQVYTGETAALAGTATDPDGDPIAQWAWSVVDSPAGSTWSLSPADAAAASFTPGAAGDYVLSLRAADAGAWGAPDYVTIHAHDNLPPVAVATADPTGGLAPLDVCLDGSGSQDPEGAPLAYAWTFGDGATAASSAVCHEYAVPGLYTATLVVTDVRGASDAEALAIEVLAPNRPPVASPTATPASGPAPLAVQFAANASDPDGDALTYSWNLGDDAVSHLPDPTHTYAAPGTYTVWLTVFDGQASVTTSLTIAVSAAIELNVTRAEIDFKSRKSQLADVEILAELYAAVPGPDDLVALRLDGALVFAAPFGAFEPVRHHGVPVPGVYKLKAPHLWVQLDFAQGRLAVEAQKVLLAGYDPRNGVDVEVMLGSAVAVDNVQPVDERGDRHYRHHRPERGRCGR